MHKNIRELIHQAKNGNTSAKYRLFEVYEQGMWGAEKNEVLAKEFLMKCHHSLDQDSLVLNELKLADFSKFGKLDVDFDSQLTIFIGKNGSGKTSILGAIAKLLSWLVASIEKEDKNGKVLGDKEVNIYSKSYAEIYSKFTLGRLSFYEASLTNVVDGAKEKRDSSLQEIKALGNLFRVTNSIQKTNLPLFMYYGVERSHEGSGDTFSEKAIGRLNQSIRFDAYRHAFDKKVALGSFVEWFVILDNWANGEADNPEASSLKNQIEALEQLLGDADDHSLSDLLGQKKAELAALLSKKNFGAHDAFNKQRACVVQAIHSLLPDISEVFIDRSSGVTEVKVNLGGDKLNINQLSDGQKMLVGLAGDLARRLVMLNPLLDNPLSGKGIVLIDEIELHLHPKWQQATVPNLQATFENIQFIMTTHSPQVLSSVSRHNIRVLTKNINDEWIATKPLAESYARSNAEVLDTMMEGSSLPDFKERSDLEYYRGIIEQGDWSGADALKLRAKLEKTLGSDHSELIKLDSVIQMKELLG